MKFLSSSIICLFIFLFSCTQAVPVGRRCARKCDESRNLLKYSVGNKYVYDFKNQLVAHIPKGTTEKVEIKLTAKAEFHIVSKCDVVLTLKDVSMKENLLKGDSIAESRDLKELPSQLTKYSLPFGFNDGRITNICPDDNDERKTMNVKRAVISQFQISMEHLETPTSLTERDVSGDCLTEYRYKGGKKDIVQIEKMKAILGCANRKMSYSDLQGQSFDRPTETSQMPLLKGSQNCNMQISKIGHLVSSECKENQVFRPFSGEKSGATFDVMQSLALSSISKSNLKPKVSTNRAELLMEHSLTGYRDYRSEDDTSTAGGILNQICDNIKKDKLSTSKVIAQNFPKFVRSLRDLDKKELQNVAKSIGTSICKGNKKVGDSIFRNAIPMVRTTASVILMFEGLASGMIKEYRRSWMFSLATVREPSIEIIEKLDQIGDKLENPLIVSGLVATYCKMNDMCEEEQAVKNIVQKITSELGNDCSGPKKKVILALRAIGNLGMASDWKIIDRCIKNKKLDTTIRVSAVQSLRKLKCDSSGWETIKLIDLFLDQKEDTEVRINSYLSLITCHLRPDILQRIIDQLSEETSQQVGTFVWSHLSNMKETSQVFRQNLRMTLEKMQFDPGTHQKMFDLDYRKYSRNYEKSYFYEPLNSGLSGESNVIYSTDSFLPKSVTLNLTAGLFGKSISLIEFGFRGNNLDPMIQSAYKAAKPVQNADSRLIHFDIDKFKKDTFGKKMGKPSADFYLRMFGNELLYASDIDFGVLMKGRMGLMAGLRQAIQDINFENTRMLMEATVSVPTVSGFPIELSLDVAMSVKMSAGLKFGKEGSKTTVSASYNPSGALGVTGRMRLDAHSTEIGIEFQGVMSRNQKIGGKFIYTGSEVTLLLDAPKEKATLIDLKSQMFLIHKKAARPQKMLGDRNKFDLCNTRRSQEIFGLKLCILANYAKKLPKSDGPSFPFSGDNELNIAVTPLVTKMSQYKLRGKYLPSKTNLLGVSSFELEVNALGSATDRQLLFAYNDKSQGPKIDMSLKMFSPIKKVEVSAKGNLRKREMDASIKLDEKKVLQLTTSHKMNGPRSVTAITVDAGKEPKVMSATLSSDTSVSSGEMDHTFTFKSKKFYITDFKVTLFKKFEGGPSVNVKNSLAIAGSGRSLNANIQLKMKEQGTDGTFGLTLKIPQDTLEYKSTFSVKTINSKVVGANTVIQHTVKFTSAIKSSNKKLAILNVRNGVLTIQHDFNPENLDTRRLFKYNMKADSFKHAMTLKVAQSRFPFALSLSTFAKWPRMKLDLKDQLDIAVGGWKEFTFKNAFKKGAQLFSITLENIIKPENVRQEAELKFPGKLFKVLLDMKRNDVTSYVHTATVAWAPKKSYSLTSLIHWAKAIDMKVCPLLYKIASSAYKDGKFYGKALISACPAFSSRVLSIEGKVYNKANKRLGFVIADVVFKTDPRDFHVGLSTKVDITKRLAFEFKTSHIFLYDAKKGFPNTELSSDAVLTLGSKKTKDKKEYGYYLTSKRMQKTAKSATINTALSVLYYQSTFNAQMDSKFDMKMKIDRMSDKKTKITQKYGLKNTFLGNAGLDLETWVTISPDSWKVNSNHKITGKLELQKIYKFSGKQNVDIVLKKGKQLTIKEKNDFNLSNVKKSKLANYKYGYTLNVIGLTDWLNNKVNLNFNSNFALEKLDYNGVLAYTEKVDDFEFSSKDNAKWIYGGQNGNLNWNSDIKSISNAFSASSMISSSFPQLKTFKINLNGDRNMNKPSLTLKGNYNGKKASVQMKSEFAKTPAKSIQEKPDFAFNMKITGDIPYVRNAQMDIKAFYQEFTYIKVSTNVVHMPKAKSKLNFSGGFSPADMLAGVDFAMKTILKKVPELKMKIGISGRKGVLLKSNGQILQQMMLIKKAGFLIMVGPYVDIKFAVSKASKGGRGTRVSFAMHAQVAQKSYIPRKTEMILDLKKSELRSNEGKLYFKKNSKSSFETFVTKFSYNTKEKFAVSMETSFKGTKIAAFEIKLPSKAMNEGKLEIFLKPKADEYLISFEHAFKGLSNFDVSLKLILPGLIKKFKSKASLFSSKDGKTIDTDLMKKAVRSLSIEISSSFKQLEKMKLKAAFGKDMKGKVKIELKSSIKNVKAKMNVDFGNPSKITGSVEVNGKEIRVTLERGSNSGSLTVNANGKQIGKASVEYEPGKLLKAKVDATSPTGERLKLKVEHSHPTGDWNWQNWRHKNDLEVVQKDKTLFKSNQKLEFGFDKTKQECSLKVELGSSFEPLKDMKFSSAIGWGETISSKLDFNLNSRLQIMHDVPNWKSFFKSAINKIEYPSKFRLVFSSQMSSTPQFTFKFEGDFIPYLSSLQLTINQKFVTKLMVKSLEKNYNLETNLLVTTVANPTLEWNGLYVRGNVPKFGELELSGEILGELNYKIKMQLGKRFIILYPKLTIKSKRLPFDAGLAMKFDTSYDKYASGEINVIQIIGASFKSAKHETSIKLRGQTFLFVAADYDVSADEYMANLDVQRQQSSLKAKISYDTVSKIYKHNIVTKDLRFGTRPVFESIAECEPYDIYADVAKCSVSALYFRTKVVLEAANDATNSKRTKKFKFAWNDLKKKAVMIIYEQKPGEKIDTNSLTLSTPVKGFKVETTSNSEMDYVNMVKFTVCDPKLEPLGHLTVFVDIDQAQDAVSKYTVRILSNLLNKEIKTVVLRDFSAADTVAVDAKMFFSEDTPRLTMSFKMIGLGIKRDLSLKLKGGDRQLDLFLVYDLTNIVKTMKVGAKAKGWRRELNVRFQSGRLLETVVDNGKAKQTVKLTSEPMQQNNGYRYALIIDYPEVKGYLKIIAQLNRSPLSVLVIIQRDKAKAENQLVINGRFMNSRNILMEIKRIIDSNQITDAYTQVTLSAEKIIETRLKWRPKVFSDAKNYLLSEFEPTKMKQYLMNRGEGLQEVAKRVFRTIGAPIKDTIKISEVMGAAQAAVNDFLMIKEGAVKLLGMYRPMIARLNLSKLANFTRNCLEQMAMYVQMGVDGISKPSKIMSGFSIANQYKKITTSYQLLYKKLQEYMKSLDDKQFIKLLSAAKKLITDGAKKFDDWLIKATKVTTGWAQQRDAMVMALRQRFSTSVKKYAGFAEKLKQLMQQVKGSLASINLGGLLSKRDIEDLTEISRKLRTVNKWMTSYFQRPRQYSDSWKALKLLFNGDLKQAFNIYFKPELNKIKSWDLQQGFANWQIYFPFDIKSLDTIPSRILSYTQSRIRSTLRQVRQGTFELGKYYLRLNEMFLRYSFQKAWQRQLPPFRSNAFIAGSQHFVTFDGINVEHSGECTYLLAHDFVNNAYSVLGQYKKMGKMIKRQYLIIQTKDAALFISPKGGLKIKTTRSAKPQPKFAPFEVGGLFVSRWKSILTVKAPNDMQVKCFLEQDVCRISVSKWSHGHINGFLGSNDYESGNDVYRGKKMTFTLGSHAGAWKVGGCRSKNYAVTADMDTNSINYRRCARVLKSPAFSRCSSKVDPSSYMQSCMNMYSMSKDKGTCAIFLMYVTKCRAEGTALRMPVSCLTCGKQHRRMWSQVSRKPKRLSTPKKNFVFIVEAKPCAKKFSTLLKQLPMLLSRNEKDRYNLISFGGSGEFQNPSVHMLGNTITRGYKRDFVKALSALEFSGKDGVDDGIMATMAAQKALDLDDEVDSSTVVVLVSCSKCREAAGYQYTTMQRLFSRRGTRFHYIVAHDFGKVNGVKIAGFDSSSAFNAQGRRVSRTKLSQITKPKDTCSALARSMSGSYWDFNTLTGMRRASTGTLLKNALKRKDNRRRVCRCSGSYTNDDIVKCYDRN